MKKNKIIPLCLAVTLMLSGFKNKTMKYTLNFYTQHNQFYICDKFSPRDTGSKNFWSSGAYAERLATLKDIIGVRIQSYGHVKGEINVITEEQPIVDPEKYDHIVEAGIEIKSGVLQVLDCPNSTIEKEIKLKPGEYCLRVYSAKLASVDIDEDEGDDYYKIEIYPGMMTGRKVIKQF